MNIFESVIDQTLNYYSQHVFDDYKTNKPKLKGRVRQKIIDDVKKIDKKIGVVEFFIKGSILTKNYSKNADIDVFVRVNANLYTEDQLRILLRPVFEEIDDTYLDDCPYPFQYYITNKKYNIENTEAAYDVLEDEWIKKSPSKNIDIDEYMDDFKKYVEQFSDFSEELRRNVIDYDILLDIPPDQIKGLRQKLDSELAEINKSIDDLSEVYKEVRDMRNEAFSEEMTPTEIKKYGIKTRLPGNVVFKLLERYYYLDLYKKIRKIIGDDGKISHSEYDELNKLLKTKLTNEKVSFKTLFESSHYIPSFERNQMMDHDFHNEEEYMDTLNNWELNSSFTFSNLPYKLYIQKEGKHTYIRVLNLHIKMVVIEIDWETINGKLFQSSIWRHNHLKTEMFIIYTQKILSLINNKTLHSDWAQTPDGFYFWKKLLNKTYNKTNCGVYKKSNNEYIQYKGQFELDEYHESGKNDYLFYIEINDNILVESTNINNLFGNVKGRRDMQHKPRHRQQQANAGMLGIGTRKSVNLMPDYQRSKGIKGDHAIDGVKKTSRMIRVKQGTPEAIRLAKKYRIDNPVGKKTVAGNQHDQGITIIFEESLDQKIKRAKRILESTPKYELYNTCVDYDDGNEVYQIVQQDEWEYPYEKTFYHNPEQQISKENFIQLTLEDRPNGDFYGYNEEYDILFKYVAGEAIHYFYHK